MKIDNQFIIICLEDTGLDGEFPKYVQPTRKRFLTRKDAEQRMVVIADSRFPAVVQVEGVKIDEKGYPIGNQAPWIHLK
jgi:hypothetical protein